MNAYFFDLGGTLLALDGDEVACADSGLVRVLPGVPEALAALAGTPVFVVTNQSGLGEGRLPRARFDSFCAQLRVRTHDAITEIAVCDHARLAGCACRKPRPGLVCDLAARHQLDLAQSVLVGDSAGDEALARAAGIGTFRWADEFFAPWR